MPLSSTNQTTCLEDKWKRSKSMQGCRTGVRKPLLLFPSYHVQTLGCQASNLQKMLSVPYSLSPQPLLQSMPPPLLLSSTYISLHKTFSGCLCPLCVMTDSGHCNNSLSPSPIAWHHFQPVFHIISQSSSVSSSFLGNLLDHTFFYVITPPLPYQCLQRSDGRFGDSINKDNNFNIKKQVYKLVELDNLPPRQRELFPWWL